MACMDALLCRAVLSAPWALATIHAALKRRFQMISSRLEN